MAKLTIATGIKTFDIEDENGNIRGQIHVNTADVNLKPRADKLVNNIQDYLEELKDADDDADLITEIDIKIRHELNAFFDDENCSDVVFGHANVLSPVNGMTYVERFLTAIMPIIKADIEEENKKSAQHIEKYTSQVK